MNPEHVYLRPGLYSVKLSVRHGAKPAEMLNRVYVDRPLTEAGRRPDTLDDYLRIVESLRDEIARCACLGQLVRAYKAKALALAAAAEDANGAAAAEVPPAGPATPCAIGQASARRAESSDRRRAADRSGRLAGQGGGCRRGGFRETAAARGDGELLKLAQLIAPMGAEGRRFPNRLPKSGSPPAGG